MNKWAAYDLFGPMRSSTPREQKSYEDMKSKYSIPFERSVFDMGDIEIDYCDICHERKQVFRKYYHYDFNCECCSGDMHFEIVRYCQDCKPVPPHRISAIVNPIEGNI